MDYAVVPGSTGGENLAYYTVVGASGVTVDVDSVNLQAEAQLSTPAFDQGQETTLIGVAGTQIQDSLAAKSTETLSYTAPGLPTGASVDSSTGAFSWTPTKAQAGTFRTSVVASGSKVDTVLAVTLRVARDRRSALALAEEGFDTDATYTTSTRKAYDSAVAAARSADASGFPDALAAVQKAVAGLELLNPKLSDGTLDYAGSVTSSLSATNVWNMVDDDVNTFSGDLTAPFTVDFGAGFRVRADAFGLRARYNFANRSEGTNVYGSNDGADWTLLTSRETTNTTPKFQTETIPVRDEVKDRSFRYLKLQVDDPGTPTDPNYPGISSFSELRIHGERIETAQAVQSVSLSSDDAEAGKAVNGDTVTLDLVASEPLASVDAVIEGVTANVTHTDDRHWQATAVLPEDVDFGRALRFSVDYTTAAGETGTTVTDTTDDTSLQLWNTHVAEVQVAKEWVDASSPQFPGTGTTASNGWRMFDGDLTTATDTTSGNGWVTVSPTDGSSLTVDAVMVHPRASYLSRGNGTLVQSSTDGGTTWDTLVTISGMAGDQDWYTFELPQRTNTPLLRIYDGHGGFTNLAEVRLLRFDSE
ncbi:putative Ig domain-containing protein [Streptomyces sp. AS02]|nr:putative Ig domain-containing protein [Streptomyces sp. AS02]